MDSDGNQSADTNKTDLCENQELRTKEKDTNASLDATHGEWLVISRSKRKTKNKGKGKVAEEAKHGNQNVVKKNFQYEKKENLYQSSKHSSEGPSFVFGKTNKVSSQTKEQSSNMSIEDGKKIAGTGYFKTSTKAVKYGPKSQDNGSVAVTVANKKRLRMEPPPEPIFQPASINDRDIILHKSIASSSKQNEVSYSGGDVNLERSLDKHLQVVLQPKHVVDERKLDPIGDSDAAMSGQDESSSEESEADEVAMAEEDNEVHD
ncbi:hypothetical protein SESBI_44855 [Sesbania bispinosa]|nr:hypothetical protein SESBI_44855 [Sesbania bispinosa]